MNDRELLELAAKAAGIKYDPEASKPHPKSGAFFGLWLVYHREPTENDRRYWNPLTDDGDALRLAVKLHMFDAGLFMALRLEETRKDPSKNDYEITRRAIVRAAAEIGKGME